MSYLARSLNTKLLTLVVMVILSPFMALFSSGSVLGAEDSADGFKKYLKWGVNIRLRNELWNTFEKQGAETENTYDFFFARARGFVDFSWEKLTVYVMVQGIKAFNLPENGAFGPGPLYFDASDDKTAPGNFQIVEAYLQLKDIQGFYFKGGRIGFKDGEEVLYKDPKLDWLIKNRLSERLIGNWDWTIVGRRFDGGTAGYANDVLNLGLFGADVTFGGYDITEGLWKDLDAVVVFGGALTLKKDALLPNTQFQLFNYFYFDDRNPARSIAGNDLKINTTGISMVGAYSLGPGQFDVMLWLAAQLGKFGDSDQRALAFSSEAGYQLTGLPWKPWIRATLA